MTIKARPRATRIIVEKLNQLGWKVLPYTPYSLDIASSDYRLSAAYRTSSVEKDLTMKSHSKNANRRLLSIKTSGIL